MTTTPDTTVQLPMSEARDGAYIAGWVRMVSTALSCGTSHVVGAIAEVTGRGLRVHAIPDDPEMADITDAVGSMTPDQAQAVIASVRRTLAEIDHHQAHSCWSCGRRPPSSGVCDC